MKKSKRNSRKCRRARACEQGAGRLIGRGSLWVPWFLRFLFDLKWNYPQEAFLRRLLFIIIKNGKNIERLAVGYHSQDQLLPHEATQRKTGPLHWATQPLGSALQSQLRTLQPHSHRSESGEREGKEQTEGQQRKAIHSQSAEVGGEGKERSLSLERDFRPETPSKGDQESERTDS